MSPTQMNKLSADSLAEFLRLVPDAALDKAPVVRISGAQGTLRIKRASSIANQVHVGRGEPIVVHVPGSEGPGRWYVLPLRWQLNYARTHAKSAAQHASHAFDCMFIKASDLESVGATLLAVDGADLRTRCIQALDEARDPVLRMMIRAINAARDAVANALIDTLQEGLQESVDETSSDGDD